MIKEKPDQSHPHKKYNQLHKGGAEQNKTAAGNERRK